MLFEQQTYEQRNVYREMNTMATSGGTVFFGTERFAQIPFGELLQAFRMKERVYNRSIGGARIQKSAELLSECVLSLKPKKVFLNLGENDLKDSDFDMDAFISQYEWILYTIHHATQADVYIVSVLSDDTRTAAVNFRLKKLAEGSGADFIDVTGALGTETPDLHIFDMMKYYIRSHPIGFADAMELVTLK